MKYTIIDWLLRRKVKLHDGRHYKRVMPILTKKYVWIIDDKKEHEKSCIENYKQNVNKAAKE